MSFVTNGGNTFCMGIDASDSDKFKISDNSILGTNDRFTLNSSGQVGIGEDSPESILHIKDTNAEIRLATAADGETARIALTEDADGDTHGGFIQYLGNGDKLQLGMINSGTNSVHFTMEDNGNVMIGSAGSGDLYLGNVITPGSSNRGMRLHSNNANFFFDFQGEANDELFFRDYDGSGGIHTRHEFGISNGAIIIAGGLTQNGSPSDIKYKGPFA